MDLRRLKTIIIIVLVIINCMLGFVLLSTRNYETREKQQVEESVNQVLAQSGISIHPEVSIPESPGVNSFYLEKMFGSTKETATKFLGENYTDKGNGEYESGSGVLTVHGNEFIYRSKIQGDPVTDFSAENIEKLCRQEMKRRGMLEDVYAFSGQNSISGGTKAIFTVRKDGAEFFDAYVSFEFSEKGLNTVSGKNIISGLDKSTSQTSYISAASILADMGKSSRVTKGMKHTIMSIKPGYYIGRSDENYKNILAIPVWQIATDTGIILHYDARNGKEIAE